MSFLICEIFDGFKEKAALMANHVELYDPDQLCQRSYPKQQRADLSVLSIYSLEPLRNFVFWSQHRQPGLPGIWRELCWGDQLSSGVLRGLLWPLNRWLSQSVCPSGILLRANVYITRHIQLWISNVNWVCRYANRGNSLEVLQYLVIESTFVVATFI